MTRRTSTSRSSATASGERTATIRWARARSTPWRRARAASEGASGPSTSSSSLSRSPCSCHSTCCCARSLTSSSASTVAACSSALACSGVSSSSPHTESRPKSSTGTPNVAAAPSPAAGKRATNGGETSCSRITAAPSSPASSVQMCARPAPVSAASVSARCTANEPSSTRFCSASSAYRRPFSIATRALGRERRGQRDVGRRELRRPPAAHVERADHLFAALHRAAEHRADPLAEHGVAHPGRRRRALAGVVRQRDRRARGHDQAADAVAQREPHLHERLGRGAHGDAHVERPRRFVDQPHPGQVGAEQLARPLDDHVQRGVDVGLGGLDLHADLDERLVGRGPPRLPLDLLDEQREMRREHRHQRARVAGQHAAAQVGHQRAADLAVRADDRLDAVGQRRARAVAQRGPHPAGRQLRRPGLADALGGDDGQPVLAPPGHGAVGGLEHGPRGVERRPRERHLLLGPMHQFHRRIRTPVRDGPQPGRLDLVTTGAAPDPRFSPSRGET